MRSLFYIFVCLVITGCAYSSHPQEIFNEAESLIHDNPKLALERLNGVDVSEFEDSATMARWALLYSEAMAANRLMAPRDTIVNIAIDFYGHHGLSHELAKAKRAKQILQTGNNTYALSAALFAQKEKEFLLYKERVAREHYMSCGVIVLLIAVGIILWQRQRLKIVSLCNEALIGEASSLHDWLSQMQTAMTGVLARRFTSIDGLCNTYYESAGTKAEQKNIVANVKSQIETISKDAAVFAEIENDVNVCRNGIAGNVKSLLKPEEYRLFVFLACGLSNRTIALLMGERIEVIYKRKSRLKAKISGLQLHDNASFADIF